MSEAPAPRAPHGRSLTGFYVAICILLGLVLLGAGLWSLLPKWPFDAAEARRRQKQTAERLGLPIEKVVDLGDGVKLELVLIPAGMFDMGSPDSETDRSDDEGPVHRVRITKSFYMGRHEVTQEVWEKVMGNNPSRFKGAKNPVDSVSWDDCQDFLKKLNALTPTPLPRGEGQGMRARLPTEAEWEWACRAGTKTRFASGDDDGGLADYAWYDANSGRTTHPVGEKQPNAWGLFDMHGNVWEWCADWYGDDYYANGARHDPTGPPTGSPRVLRGGSWNFYPRYCRSAFRAKNNPAVKNVNLGFRVFVVPAVP